MLQIRKLLVPTDFSECAEAVWPHALTLARQYGAVIHLMHVAPVLGPNPIPGAYELAVDDRVFYRQLRDEADARMKTLLEAHDLGAIRVKRVHSCGAAPGEVITTYAADEDVDVIVMGTHGRRGMRAMLLGSVAQEVLHQAPCPIYAVRPVPKAEADARPIDRLMVPVDFSVHSLNALAYARHLAAMYRAELDVVHVVDPVMNERLYRTGWKHRPTVESDEVAEARKQLDWWIRSVPGPEVPAITPHVRLGTPALAVAEVAEARGTGLLVMATHGLSGLKRFPLGSVTERLVRLAPCPVFITRPFGKSLLPETTRQAIAHTGVAPAMP